MSLLDPRELLGAIIDRYVAWTVLVSLGVTVVVLVLWILVTFWAYALCLAVGTAGGWAWHARRGW